MNELKPCPFCGGYVIFDQSFATYNRRYHGECQDCGMVFEYAEKHEEYARYIPAFGIKEVYYNIMVQKNAPFEELWNRRAKHE